MRHKLSVKKHRFTVILDKFVDFLEENEPMTTKELINEWCDWWEEHREHIKQTKDRHLMSAYRNLPGTQTLANRISCDTRFANISPIYWDEKQQRHKTTTAQWVLKDSQPAEEQVVDDE